MPESTEGQSSTIKMVVDAGLKARWEVSREKIAVAQKGGSESFVALWKSVTEVVDSSPPLYLAAGFATMKAFVESYLKVPVRTATRSMQVVGVASRAEVEKYGVGRLEAALGLLTKDAASFDELRVSVERGGKASKVDLEEATLEEIRIAARKQRPKRSLKSRNTTAVLLTKALTDGKLKGVTVTVGKAGIMFRGLQVEKLQSLISILSRVKLPPKQATLRVAA